MVGGSAKLSGWHWASAFAYLILIHAGSAFSSEGIPFSLPYGLDKIAHLCEFAVMALLFWRPFHDWRPDWPEGKVAAWIFIIVALNGLFGEIHQAYVPGRVASASDLAADITGGAIAIGWLLHREKRRVSEREPSL